MTPSREAFTFRKAAGSRVAIDAYVPQLRPSAAIQHQICFRLLEGKTSEASLR